MLKRQLNQALQSRGISASQLSRVTGVPKQRISDWLAGFRPRDMRSIKRVADVLGVSMEYLLLGDSDTFDSQAEPRINRSEFIDLFAKSTELPDIGPRAGQTSTFLTRGMSVFLRQTSDLAGVRNLAKPATVLSDSYKRILGWTLEDTRDERWMMRVHPEDRHTLFHAFENYINARAEEGKVTHRLMDKSGDYIKVKTSFALDFDLKLLFWTHKSC